MAITNEQLTIIRAGLDASAYQTGTNIVLAANRAMADSGEPVAAAAEKVTRAHLGVERQMEAYRRATIDGYAEVSKFVQIQDNLNRALTLGRVSTEQANVMLDVYRSKFSLVTAGAREAAQAIQNVQIATAAAADAMQRASQAQAAYSARSGSPGTSAPVGGAGYAASAGGGNPLYGDAYASRQSDLDAYGAALDAQRAKFVPMFAVQKQYESELAAINEALNVGAISEGEAASARDKATASYQSATAALTAYNEAQIATATASDEMQRASQAQAAYAARSGAGGTNPLYGAAYDARQGDITAAFAGGDADRAKVDDLFAASKRYEATLEQIDSLKRTGVYSDTQAAAAVDRVTTAYANQADMAQSLGVSVERTNQTVTKTGTSGHASMLAFGQGSSFATRELIVMGDEVLRGNYSRIPGSILVLTSHVAVLREGLVALVTSFAGLATLGGIAVIGGMVAFAVAAETNSRRIEALRNRLSLVRDDYVSAGQAADDAARKMSKATGAPTTDARAGASDLYANGSFAGTAQDATDITSTFYKLSVQLGDTTVDWKRMGEAINDPVALLKSLQPMLQNIDTALIEHATRLQNSGDKAGAFVLVMKTLQDATSHYTENLTPLQKSLRDVDGMFVTANGHGKTLSQTIGDFGVDSLRGAIYSFGILAANIKATADQWGRVNDAALSGVPKDIQDRMNGIPPTASAPGLASNAAIDPSSQAMIHFAAVSQHISEVVETFATHIAQIESGGHQFNKDGSVVTSSTRALGMMQVEPDNRVSGTTKTIGGQTFDLTDTAQNIQASLLMIADSYKRHNGDLKEVAADYVGRGTSAAAVTERTNYLNKLGLGGSAQVSLGEHSNAASDVARASSDSSNPAAFGVVNSSDTTLGDALKLTSGTAAAHAQDLQDKIKLLNLALAQTGNSASDVAKLTQELQKAQLEMYQAVPAATALYRAVDVQTTATTRMAGAWTQGAAAAERLTATTKAETEARTAAAPGTSEYAAIVSTLTAKYIALAAATQDVTLAQKTSANGDTLAYLRAEAGSLTMNDEQRTVMLAHLKEELDLKRIAPNADAAYVAGLLETTDAIARQTSELAQSKQGLGEMASQADTAFNTIGSALTQQITNQRGVLVDWASTARTVVQQIISEMMKLAVINPILNSVFGGNRSTLGGMIGGGGGTDTTGTVIPGSQSGGGGGIGNGTASGIFGAGLNVLGKLGGSGSVLGGLDSAISNMYSGSWLQSVFGGGTDAATGLMASTGGFTAASSLFSTGSIGGMALAGTFHSGGIIGGDVVPGRYVNPGVFNNAPRFHSGLASDEFAAILQKGERVLTAKQDSQVSGMLKSATRDASSGKSGDTHIHNWNFPPGTNADSFMRSQGQIATLLARSMGNATGRQGVRA